MWDKYLDNLSLGIHNLRMLFDSDIILGGYVGAYIEKYMEDLCDRIDARNPFGDPAREYLVPCKYKVEAAAAGAATATAGAATATGAACCASMRI